MILPDNIFSAHGCILSRVFFLALVAEVDACCPDVKLELNGVLIESEIPVEN